MEKFGLIELAIPINSKDACGNSIVERCIEARGLENKILAAEFNRCIKFALMARGIQCDDELTVTLSVSKFEKILYQIEGIHQPNEWSFLPEAFYKDNSC